MPYHLMPYHAGGYVRTCVRLRGVSEAGEGHRGIPPCRGRCVYLLASQQFPPNFTIQLIIYQTNESGDTKDQAHHTPIVR